MIGNRLGVVVHGPYEPLLSVAVGLGFSVTDVFIISRPHILVERGL